MAKAKLPVSKKSPGIQTHQLWVAVEQRMFDSPLITGPFFSREDAIAWLSAYADGDGSPGSRWTVEMVREPKFYDYQTDRVRHYYPKPDGSTVNPDRNVKWERMEDMN
jgi:hypothetical protein